MLKPNTIVGKTDLHVHVLVHIEMHIQLYSYIAGANGMALLCCQETILADICILYYHCCFVQLYIMIIIQIIS